MVSFIILTYNSKDYIVKCIKNILEQDYEEFELIIVDNCSTDGTKQILANIRLDKPIPFKIILNSSNLGYNLGNLVGINNTRGEFISIINPDVILDKAWLSNIMKMMRNNVEIMVIGGKFLNSRGEIQSTGGMLDAYGATTQRHSLELAKEFFYNPGAAVVFRKFVLSKIRFDPNLFMYYDDVDFAWQARLHGLKLAYCDDALAYHFEGHSSPGLPPSKFYHITKNRLYVCLKNYSPQNIRKRILTIVFLLFMDSIYYSFTLKSPKYFLSFCKAAFWNLFNIRKLYKERMDIQRNRAVTDSEIEAFMTKGSIEFKILQAKV